VFLHVLRVDVDDRREPGPPHRRRGRRQQPRRLRGDRARMLGLRDQLRAVTAAKAQQRRRSENVAAR